MELITTVKCNGDDTLRRKRVDARQDSPISLRAVFEVQRKPKDPKLENPKVKRSVVGGAGRFY